MWDLQLPIVTFCPIADCPAAKYLPAVFYDMYRTCQDVPKVHIQSTPSITCSACDRLAPLRAREAAVEQAGGRPRDRFADCGGQERQSKPEGRRSL